MSSDWYKENLCEYIHPKAMCKGRDAKENRKRCKYFPPTMLDCPDFNVHKMGDCGCTNACFETLLQIEKPE